MTKEELKQEAEEYALEKCKECYMCNSEENGERLYCAKFESRKEGYIASAEPREKEIKVLGERCLQLQKDKGELIDKERELEAQIDKMKCCDNCQHCGCGSCDEAGNCICDDCNEETLSEWECIL